MTAVSSRTEVVLNNRGARGVNGTVTVTSASGQSVSSRTALAAIVSPVANQSATLTEAGFEGLFVFRSGDYSAQVTADPSRINYVAPSAAPTGVSGAWARTLDSTSQELIRDTIGAALVAGTGMTILVDDAGDTITLSSATSGLSVQAEGALPGGQTTVISTGATGSGFSDGSTDFRAWNQSIEYDGAYGGALVSAKNVQTTLLHTAGTVTFGYGIQGYIALGVPSTLTTTGAVTTLRGVEFHVSHTGTGNVTSAYCFNAFADLDVGTGTISKFVAYRADDFTAGSGSRITTSGFGFFCANTTACSCPTVAAYGSEMSSGSGRFNLYFNGSANSVMAGGLRLGDLNSPSEKLEVNGNALVTGNVNVGSVYEIGGTQVVGARVTGCPGNATDLASAITLVNFLRTALITHGLIS